MCLHWYYPIPIICFNTERMFSFSQKCHHSPEENSLGGSSVSKCWKNFVRQVRGGWCVVTSILSPALAGCSSPQPEVGWELQLCCTQYQESVLNPKCSVWSQLHLCSANWSNRAWKQQPGERDAEGTVDRKGTISLVLTEISSCMDFTWTFAFLSCN